jgi:hypothetical protein
VLVLRAAFYFGESFVRAYPALVWAVGRADTAPQGQPVVTGFEYDMELPALLVAENLIARKIRGDNSTLDARRAVSVWQSRAPRE